MPSGPHLLRTQQIKFHLLAKIKSLKLQRFSFKFEKDVHRCLEQSLLFLGVKELEPQQQLVIE